MQYTHHYFVIISLYATRERIYTTSIHKYNNAELV